MSATVQNQLTPIPSVADFLNTTCESTDAELEVWDRGVFLNELKRIGLVLKTDVNGALVSNFPAGNQLKQGTYHGTQLALKEMYKLIGEVAASEFDTKRLEPIYPINRDLETKRKIYQWSDPKSGFPPHVSAMPEGQSAAMTEMQKKTLPAGQKAPEKNVGFLFNEAKQNFVVGVAAAFPFLIPQSLGSAPAPYLGPTIADCETFNKGNKSAPTDIMEGSNIGFEDDWYSDDKFAQQHFSGVNPSTIETACSDRIKAYIDEVSKQIGESTEEAEKQKLEGMKNLLSEGKDLLIQDYSYFREATGVSNEETFQNKVYEMENSSIPLQPGAATGKFSLRYACASVVIFQLNPDGRLHPLAITLDYRGSLENSITIFNKRLSPADTEVDQKNDWPWRYAKTCAQTADWSRHEIATHLVDTHLIEEAIIVATNRTIPEKHLLYELLSPHWFRTLALNSLARSLLVPAVINRLAGFGSNKDGSSRAQGLVNWSYQNFNFQDKYIPNDLKKRGFELKPENNKKYCNYPYATSMDFLWGTIRDFVKSVLHTKYASDEEVRNDQYIAAWCEEIQTHGQIPTFPTITTRDQLIDAATMCIHTASPQHTAVNYLQDYYYSFVPAKPPALCSPLPKDLATLKTYTEVDLTAALPIGTDGQKWKDWLLASQLPELLSYQVDSQYTLMEYAKSMSNLYTGRQAFEAKDDKIAKIKKAADTLKNRLTALSDIFKKISERQTPGTIEYKVLQPELTAVSILI